jgi:hypothetical protein
MKYITSALVVIALLGQQTTCNAIKINSKFTDDLVKSLAEEMNKDVDAGSGDAVAAEPAKEEGKLAKAAPAKKQLAQKSASVKNATANASANATKKPAAKTIA